MRKSGARTRIAGRSIVAISPGSEPHVKPCYRACVRIALFVSLMLVAGVASYFLLRSPAETPAPEETQPRAREHQPPPGPVEGPGAVRFVRGGRTRVGGIDGQVMRETVVPPFYLDLTEVTNADFAAWLAQANARVDGDRVLVGDTEVAKLAPGSELGRDLHVRPGRERLPVVHVTWAGAHAYCHAQKRRLPSETEWEVAARRPFRATYPWGNDEPHCDWAVYGRAPGQACAAQGPGPQPVGSAEHDQSMSEIRDLAGNVAEWTDTVAGKGHVVRGGAFDQPAGVQRSVVEEAETRANLGFRCAASGH
jgi:formylglycine-generating enzyme required for sulfatase activity